jgi:hypothetical protein
MRNYSLARVRKNEPAAFAAFCRIMPKYVSQRMVIFTKDIQNICGKSERSARELMQKLKLIFEKEPWQYITVTEFCTYLGLDEEEVRGMLDGQ